MTAIIPNEKPDPGFMGILMLDTKFPRHLGDIGNPKSFDFPVRKSVIKDAFPDTIIRQSPEKCLPAFISAAQKLEAEGAGLITTSCGFLTLFQRELEAAVKIPVLTSSLFLYNDLAHKLPIDKSLGILTIAASSLSNRHLEAASIPMDAPIGTTENGAEFSHAILENRPGFNVELARQDNIDAALALQKQHPNLGAILLECTNMPPYRDAIMNATGLPVFSILDGLNEIWRGR